MRRAGKRHNEVGEAHIGLVPAVGKDPINLKHLSLDLPVLDVVIIAEELLLLLLDQLIRIFFHDDGALGSNDHQIVAMFPVCILDALSVPRNLEAIFKEFDG